MSIEIKEKDGILQILGHINSKNVSLVKTHLAKILEVKEMIRVSLENVSGIDYDALHVLETFNQKMFEKKKSLSIFGLKNHQISKYDRLHA